MPEKEKNSGEQGVMVSGVPGFSGDYSVLTVGTNLVVLLVLVLWVFPFKKGIPDAILRSEHVTGCAGLADCTRLVDCTDPMDHIGPAERIGREGETLWL